MTQAMNDREVKLDRMRYVKNVVSSRLCYLAILLNVLYFVSIYKSDVGNWYAQILVGGSIIYNLLFMLITFLASVGVSSYQKSYSKVLFVLGGLQICRIFILPMQAHAAVVKIAAEEVIVMGTAQFVRCVFYLTASAFCLVFAGIVNAKRAAALSRHIRETDPGIAKEAA